MIDRHYYITRDGAVSLEPCKAHYVKLWIKAGGRRAVAYCDDPVFLAAAGKRYGLSPRKV